MFSCLVADGDCDIIGRAAGGSVFGRVAGFFIG